MQRKRDWFSLCWGTWAKHCVWRSIPWNTTGSMDTVSPYSPHLQRRYPLVMTNITMENHHFQWENPLFLWPFSIAMLNYQRVRQITQDFMSKILVENVLMIRWSRIRGLSSFPMFSWIKVSHKTGCLSLLGWDFLIPSCAILVRLLHLVARKQNKYLTPIQ